jgi:hypothetical protein
MLFEAGVQPVGVDDSSTHRLGSIATTHPY